MSDFSDDLSFAVTGSAIKASGTLKKVTEYKGFNQSNPEEQSGYYLPFVATPPGPDIPVSVQVNEKPEISSPEDNTFVILLGADADTMKQKTIKVKAGTVYTIDLNDLVPGQ